MEESMLTEETVTDNEEMEILYAKAKKKKLKRDVGQMAWGMTVYQIIYQLISSIILIAFVSVQVIIMTEKGKATDAEADAYITRILESESVITGMSFIMGALGIGYLFLYFRKRLNEKQMFASKKKMTAKEFFPILCVFMGVQLVADPIFMGMEYLFNLFGYTMESSLLEASAGATSWIMILFSVIGAPLFEEIIYRGFALNAVQKYGKVFAIVISAVMFGVMHMNIPQAVFAFMMGIVLGYVATEYSIAWAILLHMINNGFGELFVFLTKDCTEVVQNIIYYSMMGALTLAGVFFLWKNRKNITEYISQNKAEKKSYLYAFTTVRMLIFVLGCIALGFMFIEKL